MFEQLQHIIHSTRQLAIDELFIVFLLGVIVVTIFNPDLHNKAHHPRFTWVIIAVLAFFWVIYGKQSPSNLEVNTYFSGTIQLDSKSVFFKRLVLIASIISLLHLRFFNYKVSGEFFIYFLGSVFGMFLVSMTTHLLTIYVALEFISICSYLMVAMNKEQQHVEASIKYLLVGAASSAVMLYGISWFYGLTGTLNFADAEFTLGLAQNPAWLVQVIGFMTIGGMLFKLSAAPFHFWTPDVYEATPTPIVSFLSIAPKAVAILVLGRFVARLSVDLSFMLSITALLSLVIGNFSALWQTNFKRLLGYSTIAHAGFMLIGLIHKNPAGFQATYFYVSSYLVITMGAFMLADIIAQRSLSYEFEEMKGLGKRDSQVAFLSLVFMIGLVGFPPSVGFMAKLLVFSSLWESYQFNGSKLILFVVIFGLLNTAVSIFYYLKPPYYLLVKSTDSTTKQWFQANTLAYFVALALAVASLYLFFHPEFLMNYIEAI